MTGTSTEEPAEGRADKPVDDPSLLSPTPPFMLELIRQQQAEFEAADRLVRRDADGRVVPSRPGSRNRSSVVFTVRLAHEDFAVLERQAAARGLPTSVYGRNLLCYGMSHPVSSDLRATADDLEQLARRVRRAAP